MNASGSTKILVLAIILAAAIIGGAVMFAAKKGGQPDAAPQPGTQRSGDQVVLEETFAACGPGDSCIVVDTHCGFCCKYTAINAKNEQLFNKVFDKNCARFSGQFCQCFDLSSYPSCVGGKCQLVAWPEEMAKPPGRATPPQAAPQPAPPQPEPETLQQNVAAPPPVNEPLPPAQPVEKPPPAASLPQTQPDAFGEPALDEPIDDQSAFGERQESPPPDDLYAPLPDSLPQDWQQPRQANPNDPLNKPLPPGSF